MDEVQERALAIPEKAAAIVVADQEGLDVAGSFLVSIKTLRKEINDTFDPVIQKAHQTHKEALAQKKKVEAPLAKGEKIIKASMASYVEEQARIRREAEERQRKEREEIERKKREEEERILAEALKAEEEGKEEEAQDILEEADVFADEEPEPTTVIPAEPVTTRGVSTRKIWKWEIGIGQEDLVPREYCSPDRKKIGDVLKATNYARTIPGVNVYQETSVAARGR